MTTREPDELLDQLRALPPPPLDPLHAERVRRAARAELARARRLAGRPVARRLERAWSGVVEPALVAGAVGVYLVWAVRAAEALYR